MASHEYAHLRTKPSKIELFDDKTLIVFSTHGTSFTISKNNETLYFDVADIDWLRQALDDIKSISKMQEKTEPE